MNRHGKSYWIGDTGYRPVERWELNDHVVRRVGAYAAKCIINDGIRRRSEFQARLLFGFVCVSVGVAFGFWIARHLMLCL